MAVTKEEFERLKTSVFETVRQGKLVPDWKWQILHEYAKENICPLEGHVRMPLEVKDAVSDIEWSEIKDRCSVCGARLDLN